MNYIKYKSYIQKSIELIVAKQQVVVSKIKTKTKSKKSKVKDTTATTASDAKSVTFASTDTSDTTGGTVGQIFGKLKPVKEKPHGHFEGVNWVWRNGTRTHVRFIDLAIRQKRPLPLGFYEEARKEKYLTNVKHMLRKAEQLKLPADVDK